MKTKLSNNNHALISYYVINRGLQWGDSHGVAIFKQKMHIKKDLVVSISIPWVPHLRNMLASYFDMVVSRYVVILPFLAKIYFEWFEHQVSRVSGISLG